MKIEGYIDILGKCPIFLGMDSAEIEKALNSGRRQVKSFVKDSRLAYRGEDVSYLYILLHGSIHGVMMDPDGKYVKIEDIESPQPIATGFLYGKQHYFPVDVVANTDVKVLMIPRSDFGIIMTQFPAIQENFLNIISSRAQFLTSKIRLLSRKSIKAKLAQIIVEQDSQRAGRVEMTMSQQKVSELIGVARPSLARTFSEFVDDGIIEGSWKDFRIVQYQSLESHLLE